MSRRLLFLAGTFLLLLVGTSCPVPAESRTEAQPPYKNPLDVTVDQKGETARVVLLGTRSLALVELATGKVKEETPWPTDKPLPQPADVARHLEHLERLPENLRRLHHEVKSAGLPDAGNLRGVCATPISEAPVFVVHQRPKSRVPLTQVAQGWVFTNALTLIRVGEHAAFPLTGILDEPNHGYADPSDVVILPDGRRAFVACAGADTVLAIDCDQLRTYLDKRFKESQAADKKAGGPSADAYDNPDDLTASRHYVIAKLATQANPRRLALSGDGKTLIVSNYLADSLTVIDTEKLKVVRHIALGDARPDAVRRGEILFNSAKMTFQGQFTCASCHPNGGSDGLTWDLERDGVGNFKKTKSLLGVKDTAPYGWHGSSLTLADRVTGTLRTLHRHEPTEVEVNDLVAYLESLSPPAPLPPKEADKPAVARGLKIFQGKGQCANCHQRTALDDGKTHDVGTRGDRDTQERFDTPALRGVVHAAPYLHDGRAATLEEVFTKHNPRQRHGATHLLSKEELSDLIAYLKSL